jgi:hypothetical protein
VWIVVCFGLKTKQLNINLGIHKKFPEVLTWENLSSFKCAADFAFYIEKFNDELTISIEKSAKDTGMWLFEEKKEMYL